MCGICGLISSQNIADAGLLLARMNQSLQHRGPDDAGYWLSDGSENTYFAASDSHPEVLEKWPLLENDAQAELGFGHRRLSIIDLSAASHQPMASADGRYVLCYNGEIYNYIELRAALQALGHEFQTQGDAEVLLAAWQQWQENALAKFEGMWAFALYDNQEGKMWLVRDPSGVKPLFYCQTRNILLFASEPKALLASGLVDSTLNSAALYSFLVHAALDEAAGQMLEAVQELQPGNLLCFHRSSGEFELRNYHEAPFLRQLQQTSFPTELVADVTAKLKHAVDIRLRSDVKVGASLSGGLDSSTLAAWAAKTPGFPMFTAIYAGFPENEENYAREVADQLQADWHRVTVAPELLIYRLEELVRIQDGPILALSTFAQLLINETARTKGVRILLDGQGGDELFSGYDRYWLSYYRQAWEKGQMTKIWKGLCVAAQRKTVFKAFVYAKLSGLVFHPAMTFMLRKQLNQNKFELKYLKTDFKNQHWPVSRAFIRDIPESGVSTQQVREMYGYDLKNLLRWGDRNSMSVGIENRAPFADDPHLAQLLLRLPDSDKMNAGKSKLLLRAAMQGRLPAKIVNRTDKQGFTTPMKAWMSDLWPHWKVYLAFLPDSIDIKAVEKDSHLLLQSNSGAAFLLRLVSLGAWLKNLQYSAKST